MADYRLFDAPESVEYSPLSTLGEQMHTIEVDFDVFKALTARRPTEAVSENDVLRQLLGLGSPAPRSAADASRASRGDWSVKGVRFPEGTEFRATYNGQTFLGRVEDGALSLGGQRFSSPSAAAMSITGSHVNGWRFWQCRVPGTAAWRRLESLRQA